MKMISKLLAWWKREDICFRGKRVLCALSGGADSVAMLRLLLQAAGTEDFTVCAAHFNHRLRGEESDRDERFAEELCRSLGVPFSVGSADVKAAAKERSMGIEEAARELRYEFLQRAAVEQGADLIATAHNADDNAETVLMRLMRGTGTRGLGGIPPKRGNIVRPVLCFTGEELREYLLKIGQSHVEDSTNGSDEYLRNRLRHSVLPALRQLEPGFSEKVLETSALARSDEEFLNGLAADVLRGGTVAAAELAALHPAVSRRALRLWLGGDLSKERSESVLALAKSGSSGSRIELPGGRAVRLEQGVLRMCSGESGALETTALRPGLTKIPGWSITLREFSGEYKNTKYGFYVRRDGGPLAVRARNTGDTLDLKYRGGKKSLKKLFIDEKIPLSRRDTIPVLTVGGEAAAVPGFGISEEYMARSGEDGYIIEFEEV